MSCVNMMSFGGVSTECKAAVNTTNPLIPREGAVPVIDPVARAKYWVDPQQVEATAGLTRVLRGQPPFPSLCLLRLAGRCRKGVECHQLHITAEYAESLRRVHSATSTCCASHGDLPSTEATYQSRLHFCQSGGLVQVRVGNEIQIPVPVDRLGRTQFIDQLVQQRRSFFIPLRRICLPHQEGKCAYGVDCRHIHMCREWYPQLNQLVAKASTVVTPPRTPSPTIPNKAPEMMMALASWETQCNSTPAMSLNSSGHTGLTPTNSNKRLEIVMPTEPVEMTPGRSPLVVPTALSDIAVRGSEQQEAADPWRVAEEEVKEEVVKVVLREGNPKPRGVAPLGAGLWAAKASASRGRFAGKVLFSSLPPVLTQGPATTGKGFPVGRGKPL